MLTLFIGIPLPYENHVQINLFAGGIVSIGLAIIWIALVRIQQKIKKPKLDKPDDMSYGILDVNRNYPSEDSEGKQLQESLKNTRVQLQIAELKLQITELKIQ